MNLFLKRATSKAADRFVWAPEVDIRTGSMLYTLSAATYNG